MAKGVMMPKQGITVESCILTEWKVKVGDQVKVGDVLFAYETDKSSFEQESEFEGEVPGTAPKDCGNYLLHDLPMAKWESAKYLHEVLEQMTEDNLVYPSK